MVRYVWDIKVPLIGSEEWFSLCIVESPESVAEIVKILIKTTPSGPVKILLELRRID